MNLYHFSEEGDISLFVPRAPRRQPKAEPFVYAIDAWHSPLYLFPRECPRIGVWNDSGDFRLYIQEDWVERWLSAVLFRYDLPTESFIDCQDHGVWVSRSEVKPLGIVRLTSLPDHCPWPVHAVPSLLEQAGEFYDFSQGRFAGPDHVSMIRMSNLKDWPGNVGSPVRPKE